MNDYNPRARTYHMVCPECAARGDYSLQRCELMRGYLTSGIYAGPTGTWRCTTCRAVFKSPQPPHPAPTPPRTHQPAPAKFPTRR